RLDGARITVPRPLSAREGVRLQEKAKKKGGESRTLIRERAGHMMIFALGLSAMLRLETFICYPVCYQVGRVGAPVFVPGKNLKDLVVAYLREQERSISALTKQLRQDGYPFHRLFVTGYLKALADAGLLREKDIPP